MCVYCMCVHLWVNHYIILYFVFYFSVSGSAQSRVEIAFGTKSDIVCVIIQHPENVSQGLQMFRTFASSTVLATTTASQPDEFTDSDKIVLQEKDHKLMIQNQGDQRILETILLSTYIRPYKKKTKERKKLWKRRNKRRRGRAEKMAATKK